MLIINWIIRAEIGSLFISKTFRADTSKECRERCWCLFLECKPVTLGWFDCHMQNKLHHRDSFVFRHSEQRWHFLHTKVFFTVDRNHHKAAKKWNIGQYYHQLWFTGFPSDDFCEQSSQWKNRTSSASFVLILNGFLSLIYILEEEHCWRQKIFLFMIHMMKPPLSVILIR